MELKRVYQPVEGYTPIYNLPRADGSLPVPSLGAGDCLNPRPLQHIELHHTGATARQNFSQPMVDEGLKAGVFAFDADGRLLFKVQPETLRYKVLRVPGRYCLHCGINLGDDATNVAGAGAESRAHVAREHAGVPSPDPAVPAGYIRIDQYECDLDAAQHEKFNWTVWDAKRKGRA